MLNNDQQNREQAIEPNKSFIIQAPAGSGKTSLLIQRYLVLLTQVNKPEEILAITFTRKAAAEMRSRILAALTNASNKEAPADLHKLKVWNLATAALKHSKKNNWNLIENPNRLRIQTIDSFCNQLAKQMPILSSLGMDLAILKDQDMFQCYRNAVKYLLNSLDTPDLPHNSDLASLLLHLDNDYAKTETLLARMLAKRDQWLPHVIAATNSTSFREAMEESLTNIIKENFINCQRSFPTELFSETKALTEYATSLVTEFDDQESWREIARLFLTKEFQWRKTVDCRCGFPAASTATSKEQKIFFKTMKQRMENLLEQLSRYEEARKYLETLSNSPTPQYGDQQWDIIFSLINVLKSLAAYYLPKVFREQQAIDYIEIALAAERALGTDGAPTELALQLDYKIQHILVDEFQDTSIIQYRLLEKLTSGWQPDDGRTLFLVGDPMQSIYKFREAKVGLFLRTKQQQRINSVPLIPLTLSANFRSDQHLVDWVNTTFVNIFPKIENIGYGAVTFIPSIAINKNNVPQKVNLHSFSDKDYAAEAQKIISIVQQTQQADPTSSIAILVRSRSHLNNIIPTLKQANLPYQAVELETLSENAVIKDLFTLTRALLNLADQIAWLALLRTPWCGLTLTDIHTLTVRTPKEQPLWSVLIYYSQLGDLSADAKKRLNHVVTVLAQSLANRSKQSLRQWIKNTWIALNGNIYLNPTELENAEKYLSLLNEQDQGGYVEDLKLLEKQLSTLYADSDEAQSSLQIMTIHKAKGLEFDTVIIPALDRQPKSPEHELLMWIERPNAFDNENNELIFAPITESGQEIDQIYKYLRFENKQKEYNELSRLLYVAVTRAKKNLYLLACVNDKKPVSSSLLEQLWHCFAKPDITAKSDSTIMIPTRLATTKLMRLPLKTFVNVSATDNLYNSNNSAFKNFPYCHSREGGNPCNQSKAANLSFHGDNKLELEDNTAKNIGIVIHDCLRYLSNIKLDNWFEKNLETYQNIWRAKLKELGTFENLDEHINKITHAIKLTLNDPQGRWILDKNHHEARSEYPLTTVLDGIPKNFIIDRTFIDNDIRWIIDYKTTTPHTEDLNSFFNAQIELHKEQLQNYVNIIKRFDSRPIQAGLYFPMLGKLHLLGVVE